MKQAKSYYSRVLPWQGHGPKIRIQCAGTALFFVLAFLLAGCSPGGTGEDGIDPGIVEIPIAFIKRPIPVDDMGDEVQADIRDPRLFSSGGDVYLRTSSSVNATVSNITESVTGGIGDVKGLNASYDGSKLIFSLRLFDPDPDDDVVPSWNIYEYEIATETLRPIIANFNIANQADDLFPAYLPDGRIVFTSSRQDQAKGNMVNEGKKAYTALVENDNQYALVLHVMNDDGSGLRQISQNLSHDLYPQVLRNVNGGQIVFSRWDKAVNNSAIHLYKMNPDGSEQQLLYGAHSHMTGTNDSEIHFTQAREMVNGDLMVIARPYSGTFDGGDIVVIDIDRFVDNDKPVASRAGMPGPAQRSATVNNVTNDGSISIPGRYSSAFPLQDGSDRVLVSKSTCQVTTNNETWPCVEPYLSAADAEEASPAYAIWLYDMGKDTEKPIVLAEPGMVITEAIAVRTTLRPPVILDKAAELNSDWLSENLGVINIKSVYDMGDGAPFDGSFSGYPTTAANIDSVSDFADPARALAADRPARFVRFIKPIGLPDRDDPTIDAPDLRNTAFGRQRNLGMREIVGYAPIEPDGSVKVKVPGETPLALEILDAEGRRIGPRHNNWFQVRSGDMLTCVGCHTHPTGVGAPTPEVHGRVDAAAPSINPGIPGSGEFVNTQIPGRSFPYYSSTPGLTMAEVRFDRVNAVLPLAAPEPRLSADLVYVDYWTDPTVTRPDASVGPDAPYSYLYDDLDPSIQTPAPPARPLRNGNCKLPVQPEWRFNCRVTINYPRHIQAIWELPRGDLMVSDVTMLGPTNPPEPLNGADPTASVLNTDPAPDGIPDDTCIACHTSTDAMGNPRLPYGQLDLTQDPNQIADNFYRSYVEMFFNKRAQILDGNTLRNLQIDVPDGMGGFNQVDDPSAVIGARMTANGARRSYFIEKMTGTELDAGRGLPGTSNYDHTGKLSGAELKLIGEWLDLGGQNFNDLFDEAVPQN